MKLDSFYLDFDDYLKSNYEVLSKNYKFSF